MIVEFGGDIGLRDNGLLEAAVAMPRQQFGGVNLHGDPAEQVAAYLYHLCSNNAFVDGIKRMAPTAAEFFLLLNETQLIATNEELYEITMSEVKGIVDKKTLTEFFRRMSVADSQQYR